MRRRRQIERTRGRAMRCAAPSPMCSPKRPAEGIPPQEIQALLSSLRIRPVITAHPTESKRVTVLEKYRKIYLLLRELEMPRWTERERTALIDDLRDQIELVWMTGELHLEKPTVQHEVVAGPALLRRERCSRRRRSCSALVDGALEHYYPGKRFELPPVLPVRLVDRRRPRRQSVGDHTTSPAGRCGRTRSPRCAITASGIVELGQGAVHHRARACPCRPASSPELDARARRQRRGGADQDAQSRRALPAISLASCCASSTPPSPASKGRTSAAPARPMPMPTS